MSSRLRDLASSCLAPLGIIGISEIQLVAKAASATAAYWKGAAGVNMVATISAAYTKTVTGRNDVVLLSPDSHSQATGLTWAKNMTHLVGMYGPGRLNLRARIGHSAAVTTLLTVSGYGNTFANFYMPYGYGTSATDLTAISVSGNRNSFINCHIASPMQTAQADQAGFAVIRFSETAGGDGLEHYFKNCVIGAETVAWTNGVMFRVAGTPRLVFEDCIFLMNTDNAQVRFIDGTAGDGAGFVIFKNCIGLNRGTSLAYAIGSTGIAAATDIVLLNSGFAGTDYTIAAADEAKVFGIATGVTTAADTDIGRGVPYDHTA
jgi:hypothetical protein